MPDPVLYLQAMAAAASAAAAIAFLVGWVHRPAGAARKNLACVGGMALGLILGYEVLRLPPAWPPTNGLGRFLWIVLPAVVGIEAIAASGRTPRWFAWGLRLALAAFVGRILLHGSVYLVGAEREWTAAQAVVALSLSGAVLAIAWALLLRLARRSAGISISLAIAQASLCGGAVIMLAGYLAGGAAALPLTAALVGIAVAAPWIGERLEMQGAIGIGVVGLFSLLFIGRFFGGLSGPSALAVFLAPLLCWATEIPVLRRRKPWLVGALRLALVAIPLLAVFVAAKREFDRSGLAQVESPPHIETSRIAGRRLTRLRPRRWAFAPKVRNLKAQGRAAHPGNPMRRQVPTPTALHQLFGDAAPSGQTGHFDTLPQGRAAHPGDPMHRPIPTPTALHQPNPKRSAHHIRRHIWPTSDVTHLGRSRFDGVPLGWRCKIERVQRVLD